MAAQSRPIVEAFRQGRPPVFDADAIWRWINAADWMIENGELEPAEAAVRALNAAQPELEWASNLCALFDHLPEPCPGLADFHDDMSKDVQVVARDGATVALIVFCGARHRIGMPLPLMHRWLSRLDASLIYLRDFHELCYLRGVASLGGSLAQTTDGLRRRLAELGADRLICYGSSGGGYGALRYALELGGGAISLGSPTNLSPAFNTHMNHGAFAKQLQSACPAEELDLRRLFEARATSRPVLIVYGERNWNERIHAEHFGGLAGVTLHGVPGYGGHATAAELIRRGELEPMLEGFLRRSLEPVGT